MTRAIERSFPAGTRVTPAGRRLRAVAGAAASRATAAPLFAAALAQGICFAPGDVFSASGRYANCLRLSCGHPWDARIEARRGASSARSHRNGCAARTARGNEIPRAACRAFRVERGHMIGFAAVSGGPRRPPQPGTQGTPNVPDILAELRRELATAYRIVANEGMLDAFGHISVRHPDNPQRYFLSRSRAPALVEPDDILEYDLDSNPIVPPATRPYSERVIHGEIFKARPDVMRCATTTRPRSCRSRFPACRSCRSFISAPRWGATRRSGTAATNSATPTCWW